MMMSLGPLILAVLIASLLGSFHCAGMCGAFLAIATGSPGAGSWRTSAGCQAAYHGGRLVTYVLLGAAAGAAGRLLDLAGALAGLSRVAAILAGASMVFFAIVAILRARGVRLGRMPLPAAWVKLMHRGHRAAMSRPPLVRAASIGLLTTLLPCGWLYAFAVTAAGTGRPLAGAAVMAVFWAGTLPILVALGAGIRGLLGPVGRHAPVLTAALLAAAGLYTLIGRAKLAPAQLAESLNKPSHVVPVAASAGGDEPPCCCSKKP